MSEDQDNFGQVLNHTQDDSSVELFRSPAVSYELQGPTEVVYEWQTKAKHAIDLELRARVVAAKANPTHVPVVRWNMKLGHGAYNWPVPALLSGSSAAALGGQSLDEILPARGLVLRLSARQLFFGVRFTDYLPDPVPTAAAGLVLQVSCQPARPKCCVTIPDQWIFANNPALVAFPDDARQFRVRDGLTGLPFAPGVLGLTYASLTGTPFPAGDAASFADWTPIPPPWYGMTFVAGAGGPAVVVQYQ